MTDHQVAPAVSLHPIRLASLESPFGVVMENRACGIVVETLPSKVQVDVWPYRTQRLTWHWSYHLLLHFSIWRRNEGLVLYKKTDGSKATQALWARSYFLGSAASLLATIAELKL